MKQKSFLVFGRDCRLTTLNELWTVKAGRAGAMNSEISAFETKTGSPQTFYEISHTFLQMKFQGRSISFEMLVGLASAPNTPLSHFEFCVVAKDVLSSGFALESTNPPTEALDTSWTPCARLALNIKPRPKEDWVRRSTHDPYYPLPAFGLTWDLRPLTFSRCQDCACEAG